MKGLVIAALLVLCISSLEAVLQCYRCVSENEHNPCSIPDVEVCKGPKDQCARVTRNFPRYVEIRSCMSPEELEGRSSEPLFKVESCTTDLCN